MLQAAEDFCVVQISPLKEQVAALHAGTVGQQIAQSEVLGRMPVGKVELFEMLHDRVVPR